MKSEEIKYPQKYSLMPIIKQVGWKSVPGGWDSERDERVVAYVAMECYLFQEVIDYNKNGTTSTKYLVLFAKSPIDFSTEIYPGMKGWGVNTRGQYVNYITDTLEEAKKFEEIVNNEIIEEAGAYHKACERENIKNQAIETIAEYVNKAEQRRRKPVISPEIYV